MSEKRERFSKIAGKKSKEESKSKDAKKTLLTGKDTTQTIETNTHAEPDASNETNQETQEDTKNVVVEGNQQEAKKDNESDVKLYNDPTLELINVVASGKKKKKLEDERIRCTYWLHEDERKMVNKIAKETGYPKYDVVGMAIRSMYDRVMQAKPEKKIKPDQQ